MTNGNETGGTALVNHPQASSAPPTAVPASALKRVLRSADTSTSSSEQEAALLKEEHKILEEDDEEVTSEEEDAAAADAVERTMITVALVKSVVETKGGGGGSGGNHHSPSSAKITAKEDPSSKHRYGLRKRRRPSGMDLQRLEHNQSTKDGGLARGRKDSREEFEEQQQRQHSQSEGDGGGRTPDITTTSLVQTKVEEEAGDGDGPENDSMDSSPQEPLCPPGNVVIPPQEAASSAEAAMPPPPSLESGQKPGLDSEEATGKAARRIRTDTETAILPNKPPPPPPPLPSTIREAVPLSSPPSTSSVPNPLLNSPAISLPSTEDSAGTKVVADSKETTSSFSTSTVPCPLPLSGAHGAASETAKPSPAFDFDTTMPPPPSDPAKTPAASESANHSAQVPLQSSQTAKAQSSEPEAATPDVTPSDLECSEKRKVTISHPGECRIRAFSIDIDSLGLDIPPDDTSTSAPAAGNAAAADMPALVGSSGGDSDGGGRDRAFSFECFAFGINADEPLPPLDQSAAGAAAAAAVTNVAPAPASAGAVGQTSTAAVVDLEAHVVAATMRPRGDSIIFDPVSFQDGGIHERNALEKARSSQLEATVKASAPTATTASAPAPEAQVSNPLLAKAATITSYPANETPASPTATTGPTADTAVAGSATTGASPLASTQFPMDLLNKDGRIGIYLPEARRARIARFHAKRAKRIWRKRIKYDCRKKLADSRPRIKGRFVKRSDME